MRFLTAAFAITLPLMLLLFCVTVKSHLIKVLPILSAADEERECPRNLPALSGEIAFIIDGAALPLEDATRPRAGAAALRPAGAAATLAQGLCAPQGQPGLGFSPPIAGTGSSTRRRAPALAQAGAARGPGTREGGSGARLVWAGGCYEHRGLCRAPAPHDPLRPQRGVWGKEM